MVFEKKIIKIFCDKYIINDKKLVIQISLWGMFVIHFQYMEKWLSYFYKRKNAYHTVSYIKNAHRRVFTIFVHMELYEVA